MYKKHRISISLAALVLTDLQRRYLFHRVHLAVLIAVLLSARFDQTDRFDVVRNLLQVQRYPHPPRAGTAPIRVQYRLFAMFHRSQGRNIIGHNISVRHHLVTVEFDLGLSSHSGLRCEAGSCACLPDIRGGNQMTIQMRLFRRQEQVPRVSANADDNLFVFVLIFFPIQSRRLARREKPRL